MTSRQGVRNAGVLCRLRDRRLDASVQMSFEARQCINTSFVFLSPESYSCRTSLFRAHSESRVSRQMLTYHLETGKCVVQELHLLTLPIWDEMYTNFQE
jgi:hypothetical protein